MESGSQFSQVSRVKSPFAKVEWQLWKSVSSLQPEQQQVPFWLSYLGLPPKQFGQRGILPKVAPSAHLQISSSLFPDIDCIFFLKMSFKAWFDMSLNLATNALYLAFSSAVYPLGPDGAAFLGTARFGGGFGRPLLAAVFLTGAFRAVFLTGAFRAGALMTAFLIGVFLGAALGVEGFVFLFVAVLDVGAVFLALLLILEEDL